MKTLGLSRAELKNLSPRMVKLLLAVAALRDAWASRLDANTDTALVVVALKTLLATHELYMARELPLKVVRHGLVVEDQKQLLNELYPPRWAKVKGGP